MPLLYILAMGVLLGGFIEGDPAKLEGATSYLAFVAPGMLAAQTMTTVFGELTYPVMGMIKWHKTYYSMIATPLTVGDLVMSTLGFVMFRVGTVSAVFILVMAPFGVFTSWWGVVVAFFVQLLLGLAFATPIYALSASIRNESGLRPRLPARDDPDVPVLGGVLPDLQPEPRDGVARPGDARCGTGST